MSSDATNDGSLPGSCSRSVIDEAASVLSSPAARAAAHAVAVLREAGIFTPVQTLGMTEPPEVLPEAKSRTDVLPERPVLRHRFKIRGLDGDASDALLRAVLDLVGLGLDARTIGRRLGPDVGDDDVPAATIRYWHLKARRMRDEGLI